MKATQPSYAGYSGLLPFSEPEAASLGSVTLQYQPSVVISYHSMGEVAYWNTTESRYTEINRGFSSYMLTLVPYRRMGGGSASGSYLDWIYSGETPVRSITFETGNVECPLPAGQYPKIRVQHDAAGGCLVCLLRTLRILKSLWQLIGFCACICYNLLCKFHDLRTVWIQFKNQMFDRRMGWKVMR